MTNSFIKDPKTRRKNIEK
ncbi:hypothetical protein AYI68_g7568, partial [Smittium mucronatum]